MALIQRVRTQIEPHPSKSCNPGTMSHDTEATSHDTDSQRNEGPAVTSNTEHET